MCYNSDVAAASDSTRTIRARILCSRVKLWSSFVLLYIVQVTQLCHSATGGYLCTNSLRALIAVWLNASQRSQEDGDRLNRSARQSSIKHFEQSSGLVTALYKNLPVLNCVVSYSIAICNCHRRLTRKIVHNKRPLNHELIGFATTGQLCFI